MTPRVEAAMHPASGPVAATPPRPVRIVLRMLRIAGGCALFVVCIYIAFGRIGTSGIFRTFGESFLYAASISGPSEFLIRLFSRRYAETYPRLLLLFHAIALLFCTVAGSLVTGLLLLVIGVTPRAEYWPEFRYTASFATIISIFVGLGLVVHETLQGRLQRAQLEARTQQRDWERASKLLAEAQLSSLESRVHPHFLFNTLNSIASLIPKDPVKAEQTVGRLASLLRFSLYDGRRSMVPLGRELKIVRDYLEIEKVRLGERLHYEISSPPSLDEFELPALTLQSLVENSIKYAIENLQEGGQISVIALEEPEGVRFDVVDNGPCFSLENIQPGHGLDNLMDRLEILFGPSANLAVLREDGNTIVRLSLPAVSSLPGGPHDSRAVSLLPR